MNMNFYKLNHDFTKAVRYEPNNVLNIGPFFIRFLRTRHSVPCYGMRITDGKIRLSIQQIQHIKTNGLNLVQMQTYCLADCNFYAHQDGKKQGI